MPKRRLALACAVVLSVSAAGSADRAAAMAPSDPRSNYAANPACPSGATCLPETIAVLDRARARLGLPGYRLPNDFAALDPSEQAFVLTNLDRALYGLEPIAGLTAELDAAAAGGVRTDADPMTGLPSLTVTSNWAGGYPNLPLAYEAWMYDDGPGGANLDCPTPVAAGCWDHRHDILWRFTGGGPLAMGAAVGADARGTPGEAMLLIQGTSAYHPAYLYTWSQAVASGAGNDAPAPPSVSRARPAQAPFRITLLRTRGHSLALRVLAPRGISLSCALTRSGRGRLPARYLRCGSVTTYRNLRSGAYRLRVRAARRVLTRYFRIR